MTLRFRIALSLLAMILCANCECRAQSDAQSNYIARCQSCHGPTGAGETVTGKALKIRPFNDVQVMNMTDATLNTAIANGSGKMPAFQSFYSGDQISALVQYLHQLQTTLQSQ
jgi:cytochrome c6